MAYERGAPRVRGRTADQLTPAEWEYIEDAFCVWAMRIYYYRTYSGEPHPLLRFVKAIVASARPIRDRQEVVDWYVASSRRKGSRLASARQKQKASA